VLAEPLEGRAALGEVRVEPVGLVRVVAVALEVYAGQGGEGEVGERVAGGAGGLAHGGLRGGGWRRRVVASTLDDTLPPVVCPPPFPPALLRRKSAPEVDVLGLWPKSGHPREGLSLALCCVRTALG